MGKLYLIPTTLCDNETVETIPSYIVGIIANLRLFMVEDDKAARVFLRKIVPSFPLQESDFFKLNEHTKPVEAQDYFAQIKEKDIGIISEAGLPCVADPGADMVLLAHQRNIEVVPLVGPSSIFLALMSSGLNGQNFAFNGYLPKEKEDRRRKIKALEERSFKEGQTQIFMETPYRNEALFEDLIDVCAPKTLLSIACDLTSATQQIKTKSIFDWQKSKPSLDKRPTIFLLQKKS